MTQGQGMNWAHVTHYVSFATPEYLKEAIDKEFGITLDPCPLNSSFDPATDQDGLLLNWDGHHVFCNPPWNNISPWVEKALESSALTVFVLPARTDTAWFHRLYNAGAEIRLFRKRVRFLKDGITGTNAAEASMVVIVRKKLVEETVRRNESNPALGAPFKADTPQPKDPYKDLAADIGRRNREHEEYGLKSY